MSVFVIVELISVTDPKVFNEYITRAPAVVEAFGGELLGHGGEAIAGEPTFSALVVERWPSADAIRSMLESESYKPLAEMRKASCQMRMAVVPSI